jgi:antitoxin (DNA-binding transcriptional repressor) of toxin-antitoxin stability system
MIRLNVHEAKTHLSRYLAQLAQGETIVLCRHNTPIAEIRALPAERTKPRKLGQAKGKVEITPAFFADLPADVLAGFEGREP